MKAGRHREATLYQALAGEGAGDGRSLEELRDAQARLGRDAQVDRVSSHVEQILLDGSYEVVEELGS